MAFKQKKSMIAGTDPVKKMKEANKAELARRESVRKFLDEKPSRKTHFKKLDEEKTKPHPDGTIEEQLERRNNNKKLKDQCAKANGTWDTTTGRCKYPTKK